MVMNWFYSFFSRFKKSTSKDPVHAETLEVLAKLRDTAPVGPIQLLEEGVVYSEISRVQIQPGDIVVVKTKEYVSEQGYANFERYLSKVFPGHQILILDNGTQMDIVAPTDAEKATSAITESTAAELIMRLNAAENRERAKAEFFRNTF
jgi:hypothetical protein